MLSPVIGAKASTQPSAGGLSPSGRRVSRIWARLMLDGHGMETLAMIRARHPQLIGSVLLVLALVLAACNPGDNSGGGGGPY
jgi:hypothetical protein